MIFPQQTYSQLYRDFKEIDHTAYRVIIRFYEERESDLKKLELDEYLDMLIAYAEALFETGSYDRHLVAAAAIVERSILDNIKMFRGEDIYYKTLFRKAASHFNLMEYDRCEHVLRELIKMNPYDEVVILFLKKCQRHQRPPFVQHGRAASIFLFLLSALIISVEVLLVHPFYEQYQQGVEAVRNGIFLLGWVSLGGTDLFHRWQVNNRVNALVGKARMKKSETKRRIPERQPYDLPS